MPKPKPKIEEVTRAFGKAHAEESDAKRRMAKLRTQFFDLIAIPDSELAQQTIFATTEDPDRYVATLYPKWRIVTAKIIDEGSAGQDAEWKLVIQEDPKRKTYQYINPLDRKVYARTVAESAPDIDLERLKAENPLVYESITFQPEPRPRELKALSELTDDQKEIVKAYLDPPKLTNRMESPRPAKPEELEALPEGTHVHDWQRDSRGDVGCTCGEYR